MIELRQRKQKKILLCQYKQQQCIVIMHFLGNACLPSLRPNLLAFGATISTEKEEVLKIGNV